MQIIVPPPPLRGEIPSVLLGADKPDGAKAHSSGELKHPSSQPMLARIGVATDAIIPRRPPNLGGEFKVLDNSYIITLI